MLQTYVSKIVVPLRAFRFILDSIDAILAVEPGNDKRSYLFTTNVARHD